MSEKMIMMRFTFPGNRRNFTVDYVLGHYGLPIPVYVSYYSTQNDAQQKLYKVEPRTYVYRVIQYHLGKIFGWL